MHETPGLIDSTTTFLTDKLKQRKITCSLLLEQLRWWFQNIVVSVFFMTTTGKCRLFWWGQFILRVQTHRIKLWARRPTEICIFSYYNVEAADNRYYTPLKFRDCILHSCDTITVTDRHSRCLQENILS